MNTYWISLPCDLLSSLASFQCSLLHHLHLSSDLGLSKYVPSKSQSECPSVCPVRFRFQQSLLWTGGSTNTNSWCLCPLEEVHLEQRVECQGGNMMRRVHAHKKCSRHDILLTRLVPNKKGQLDTGN